MAVVSFNSVQKNLPIPKRASSLEHWWKAARKTIKEIPEHKTPVEVSVDQIKWSTNLGDVIIERRKSLF